MICTPAWELHNGFSATALLQVAEWPVQKVDVGKKTGNMRSASTVPGSACSQTIFKVYLRQGFPTLMISSSCNWMHSHCWEFWKLKSTHFQFAKIGKHWSMVFAWVWPMLTQEQPSSTWNLSVASKWPKFLSASKDLSYQEEVYRFHPRLQYRIASLVWLLVLWRYQQCPWFWTSSTHRSCTDSRWCRLGKISFQMIGFLLQKTYCGDRFEALSLKV